MKRAVQAAQFVVAACVPMLTLGATAENAPAVTLTRLECGNEPAPVGVASFSDTYAHEQLKLQLTYSCYLIRHGDEYLLWDAGVAVGSAPEAPSRSLVQLLGRLDLAPEQIRYLGVSHYHYDHIGQAASFPHSTLLIGGGDWNALSAGVPGAGIDAEEFASLRKLLEPWLAGRARVEPLTDSHKDVFGDGTVVMISLPGHTPGHHALLVRLKRMGAVLLTGDVTHFRENYAIDGAPRWNSDRADTLASLRRFKEIAENLDATVIIQHDPRDVGKLPEFPEAAE